MTTSLNNRITSTVVNRDPRLNLWRNDSFTLKGCMTTLQIQINDLLSFLLKGVVTQKASSDIATNKSNNKVKCNNSHDDIDNTISINSGLYYALIGYVNQYIYHTVKLFCFIGRCREYNSQFIGKYLQLVSFLVTNRPDTLSKQNEEYSHV